jgi:hypothetical protein
MNQSNQYPDQEQPKRHGFGWGKTAGMLFAVIIPAVLVILANKTVFPEASWLATGMVVTTMGISIIFAVASAFATPKVKRYVLIAAFAIDLVLAGNLALHWVLAREVSGAKQATTARHDDEDRAEKRRDDEAKRQLALKKADAVLMDAERRRLAQLPVSQRRSTIRPQNAESPDVSAVVAIATTDKPLTIEQIMGEYTPWLLGFAIAELLVSVVAFGICALLWEWDFDGDGVDDAKQQGEQGRAPTLPARNTPGFAQAQDKPNPKAQSDQDQ